MKGPGRLVWWPFAGALQGELANHREVRPVKSRGVERRGDGARQSVSGVDHEVGRKQTTVDVSKAYR